MHRLTPFLLALGAWAGVAGAATLETEFATPPDAARPGVYWYFMDGNLNKEGMTADLEAMKQAGLGHALFLEVNVGVPRGPVNFLSEAWQDLYVHAVREAERNGIEIMLGSGPGWTGSGGPWVKPEQSMQHLVASRIEVRGPARFSQKLPVAAPRPAYFGLPGELRNVWSGFCKDVVVLAFPTPAATEPLPELAEKSLYLREPFTSKPGIKPYLASAATYPATPAGSAIPAGAILDLTDRLKPDGSLDWEIPEGSWTVLRFVSRNNGMSTRPAPAPGIGFECDKWDPAALDAHLDNYVGKLLAKVGKREPGRGWTMLHIDSWEMGAQNWTPRFREEFRQRRGYDPQPYYPAYLGYLVGSRAETERFLWDLRETGSELIVAHHAERLKAFGRQHGFTLSIEPYDMHPGNDFDLGAVADLPMAEFWSRGFNSAFSCLQASSIAHVMGCPVVGAESFTADGSEAWQFYPGTLKNQGDWAFGAGINRFTYHTFAHKPDNRRPGMVMGPYGVHWDRGQTWWPMADAYHRYITRCQHLLRQGSTVADVLYLMPEGAPNVFQPPPSACTGSNLLPDRRGYNFDGCSAKVLLARASVRDGRVVFPGGASYRLLVLPNWPTMTPELLAKLESLIQAGATVAGMPPQASPSLVGYPGCDQQVTARATALWGGQTPPAALTERQVGKGRIFWGGALSGLPARRPIGDARWIWYPEGNPAQTYPVGKVRFRREFSMTAKQRPVLASLEITADNSFAVTVNGTPVGTGDNFHEIGKFDLQALLRDGKNEMVIEAENGGDAPNPAGLIAALQLRFADGSEQCLATDGEWQAAKADAAEWRPAKILGPAAMAPWSLSLNPVSGLYPDYELTAGILAGSGLQPDFVAPATLRYTHRHLDDREIYFVANRSDKPVEADASFRVEGRSPELWDPLTGNTRALPQFKCANGMTTIPLEFAPYGSLFIVFPRQSTAKPGQEKTNFARLIPVATLEGGWDVGFDPAWGGPAQVRFESLVDWTARPEAGIRHYSGIATYRKNFDLPAGTGPSVFLDLGKVNVMARVRVNGQDCGVAWTAPWQVDISKAVKPAGNTLEIDVVNLWINRLVGDSSQPADKRLTWTTYNHYRPNSPLLPSGLLGPVILKQAVK